MNLTHNDLDDFHSIGKVKGIKNFDVKVYEHRGIDRADLDYKQKGILLSFDIYDNYIIYGEALGLEMLGEIKDKKEVAPYYYDELSDYIKFWLE